MLLGKPKTDFLISRIITERFAFFLTATAPWSFPAGLLKYFRFFWLHKTGFDGKIGALFGMRPVAAIGFTFSFAATTTRSFPSHHQGHYLSCLFNFFFRDKAG